MWQVDRLGQTLHGPTPARRAHDRARDRTSSPPRRRRRAPAPRGARARRRGCPVMFFCLDPSQAARLPGGAQLPPGAVPIPPGALQAGAGMTFQPVPPQRVHGESADDDVFFAARRDIRWSGVFVKLGGGWATTRGRFSTRSFRFRPAALDGRRRRFFPATFGPFRTAPAPRCVVGAGPRGCPRDRGRGPTRGGAFFLSKSVGGRFRGGRRDSGGGLGRSVDAASGPRGERRPRRRGGRAESERTGGGTRETASRDRSGRLGEKKTIGRRSRHDRR